MRKFLSILLYYSHFETVVLQADGADFDVVFLKKLPHIVLAEPHRVVPDVDFMGGSG